MIDTLLTQEVLTAVMPIADNIEYIRSQLRMFEDIFAREEESSRSLTQAAVLTDRELTEVYGQIRTLRTDLVSSNDTPSATAVEERVRTEGRIRELEETQSTFDEAIEHLKILSETLAGLLAEESNLPKEKMSQSDKRKLNQLTILVRQRAKEFGFSTFDPTEVTISEDTYRPQKEGFEIGFETSASDAIRLKWAYQLGLLELGTMEATNHPGLCCLMNRDSSRLREQVSKACSSVRQPVKQHNQQVIFSTSEDLQNLQRATAGLDCERRIFSGYMIQPVV